jgi:hypothetical protein
MNACRAITAIEGNIKQISKFYEDLIILDNSIGFEYDEDFQTLLDETEMLRSKFAILEGKILTDNPELKSEIDKENTRIDGLKFILNEILDEQKLIKKFGDNPEKNSKYRDEINMLEHSTISLEKQYKIVRHMIRWDNKKAMM